MNIKKLRQTMREKRQKLSTPEQNNAAQALSTRLVEQLVPNTKRVAIYLANDGEIQTDRFINCLWQQGIVVYLPVLHPFSAGNLLFLRYEPSTKMLRNKYDILEPVLDIRLVCPANRLDIIYTPLVAFDNTGNRMGMGGGYYDRTLAHNRDIATIGLAHDCQQVDTLKTQPWDIPLDYIITPTRCINAQ